MLEITNMMLHAMHRYVNVNALTAVMNVEGQPLQALL